MKLYQKILLNRAQPIGMISYCYMLSPFGIYLPYQSAAMIFQPVVLSLILVANFAFFTVTDWPYKKTKNRFNELFLIYCILISGAISIEIPSLFGHTFEIIFHESHTENKNLEHISKWLIVYSILGNFMVDVYFFYLSKISNNLTIRIIRQVLDTL